MPLSVTADGGAGLEAPTAITESGIEIDKAPWDGPIAVQLAHSRDGRAWERFEDRSPIIPRGGPGSFDAGCILCSADRPLIRGDEVWHYYTGVNTMHGGPMPPKRIAIGRAVWRLDGFVSLDAGHFGGVVETVALQQSGERLEVNVDAAAGSLAVEVCCPPPVKRYPVTPARIARPSIRTACARPSAGMALKRNRSPACRSANPCVCASICRMPDYTAFAFRKEAQNERDLVF